MHTQRVTVQGRGSGGEVGGDGVQWARAAVTGHHGLDQAAQDADMDAHRSEAPGPPWGASPAGG